MENNNNKFEQEIIGRISIYLGSTVKTIPAAVKKMMRIYGIDPSALYIPLTFDFTNRLPEELASSLGLGPEDYTNPDSHVDAAIPDKRSLEQAEKDGLLIAMPKDWYIRPGSIADNGGASGNPCIGNVLVHLNKQPLTKKLSNALRQTGDYIRKWLLIQQGMRTSDVPTRIAVRVVFSTVGATGSGSFYWFINGGIQSCAKQNGVEAKTIIDIMVRGNLPVPNIEQANLNELNTSKFGRAVTTGWMVDPATGLLKPVPFDLAFMTSNMNCHGNISSLDRLMSHQAHLDWFLNYTPGGQNMKERNVDIETIEFDEYGDPKFIHTASEAEIHWDRKRVTECCSHKAAQGLAESLGAPGDPAKALDDATRLARSANIVESEEENAITRKMLQTEAGETAIQRAHSIINDQTANTKGLQKYQKTEDAITNTRESEIPNVIEPMMHQQARLLVDSSIEIFDKYSQQTMRKSNGLWYKQQSFSYLRETAEKSKEAIAAKAADIHEMMQSHQQIIAEASEQLQRIAEGGRITRIFNAPLTGRIGKSLEQSGRALISLTLELLACNIAIQDFLVPVTDYLDRKLSWLKLHSQKLMRVSKICQTKATSIANASTVFTVPNGFELASPEYLADFFTTYVQKSGGADNFKDHLRSLFLTKYDSFELLAEASEQDLLDVLTGLCRDVFEPLVQHTNVYNEFIRLYPDKKLRLRMIRQLVQESEGRLLIEGEINKNTVWIKTGNAPCEAAAKDLKDLLEAVDKKPGKWDIAVNDDPETISIAQHRGGISATPFIERLELPDNPKGWELAISKAVDPVTAIMVGPNPNQQQLKRVITKAIATGSLTIDADKNFILTTPYGKERALGSTIDSVITELRYDYRQLVFIESKFARDLVVAEEPTIQEIKKMSEQIKQKDSNNQLFELIDQTAIEECLIQSKLLLPRLRRLRKTDTDRLLP